MSLGYTNGAYNRASGTRNAFGALSDALQREGYPGMVSRSGDREYADQLKIWNERMVLAGDIRGRHVYATKRWQGKTWYQIHPDSVATPTNPPTSNHGKRRANDLTYPYNDASTAAHKRARALAPRFNITCEGLGFSRPEDWHWTFWGALGPIDQAGTPAGTGGSAETGDEFMAKIDDLWQRLLPGEKNVKTAGDVYLLFVDVVQRVRTAVADTTKAVWDQPVRRDGKNVSALQELADAKTLGMQNGAKLDELLKRPTASVSLTDAQVVKLADEVGQRVALSIAPAVLDAMAKRLES